MEYQNRNKNLQFFTMSDACSDSRNRVGWSGVADDDDDIGCVSLGIEVECPKGDDGSSRRVLGEERSLDEAVRVVSVAGEAISDCVADVGVSV